jgi:mRNA interferase RelE/StbE
MTYKLRFHELALAEWRKLDGSVREPLKKKMAERLQCPRVPSAALSSMTDCYKIKLRGVGYRLVLLCGLSTHRPPQSYRRRISPA